MDKKETKGRTIIIYTQMGVRITYHNITDFNENNGVIYFKVVGNKGDVAEVISKHHCLYQIF